MKKLSIFILLFVFLGACISKKQSNDWLFRIQNASEEYGYINSKGDTIIPFGKYLMCQDSVIKELGFVYSNKGIFGINTKDSVLFEVFNYDNGPDLPSDGLFRIVKEGKIGYADLQGKVRISPRYKCAWPFEKGKAKVSYNCSIKKKGEYDFWEGGEWLYIDKNGKEIKE